jgi:cytochrome c peroxidase
MRCSHALVAGFIALSSSGAFAADAPVKADPALGQRLFQEAKCNGCHEKIMKGDANRIFTRPDRRITSVPALQKMVRFCIEQTGASLFPEDAEHIAAYLNAQFYHLK